MDNNFKSSVFQDAESLAHSGKAADEFIKKYGKPSETKNQFEEMIPILVVRNTFFDDSDLSKNFNAAIPKSTKFTPTLKTRDAESLEMLQEVAQQEKWNISEVSISHQDYEKFMRIQYCINLFKGIETETQIEDIEKDPLGQLALAELKKQLPGADETEIKAASNVLQQAFCKELDDYCGWLTGVSNFRVTAPFEKIETTSEKVTMRFVHQSPPTLDIPALPNPALLPKQEDDIKKKYKSQGFTFKETKIDAHIPSYTRLCVDKNNNWIVELNPGKTGGFFSKSESATLSLLTENHQARQNMISMDGAGHVTTKINLRPTLTFGSDTSFIASTSSSSVPSSPASSEPTSYSLNNSARNSLETSISSIDSIDKLPTKTVASNSANLGSYSSLTEKNLAFQNAFGKAGTRVFSPLTIVEATMSLERYTEIQGPKVFEDKEKNIAYILNYRRQPTESSTGPIQPVFIAIPSELVANAAMNQTIHIKMRKDKSLNVDIPANKKGNDTLDLKDVLKPPETAKIRKR